MGTIFFLEVMIEFITFAAVKFRVKMPCLLPFLWLVLCFSVHRDE